MADQVRTMVSSVIYKNKFRMGDMTINRILVIPYEIGVIST